MADLQKPSEHLFRENWACGRAKGEISCVLLWQKQNKTAILAVLFCGAIA
jgi:hypothetical protein